MQVTDEFGLPVAQAQVDEALTARTTGVLPQAAVLRVLDPPQDRWAELSAAGFVRKPAWITWHATTPGSDDELMARLTRRAAQDLRRAVRRADGGGLRIEVRQPVDASVLDDFFDLYERNVAEMRYGFAFARQQRDAIVDAADYFAVLAFDGERLVGGCVAREALQDDVVWLRYSGVAPQWRVHSLARVLYFEAFRAARKRGFAAVTLGNDPNLYGHVAKPGLYVFKSRLGFTPIPAGILSPSIGGDVAELIISLDLLTDPSMVVGYDADVPDAGLMLYAFSGAELDVSQFRTPGIDRVQARLPLTVRPIDSAPS